MERVIRRFTQDPILSVEPLGCGHINRTYLVTTPGQQLVLQKINTAIFKDVDALMHNILSVTSYLKQGLGEGEDPKRAVLNVLLTLDGDSYVEQDGCWRMYRFVENNITYQKIQKPQDFYNCGYAFGDFMCRLANFPVATLNEVIPRFHDTQKRMNDLKEAIKNDAAGRASSVQKEIDFCLARDEDAKEIVTLLKNGTIPYRVTHNDTKLNNILFDRLTGKPLCVIDLDTVMPGAACYDFGDSIRFGASSAAEDEPDVSKVYMDLNLFSAYAEGYMKSCGKILTKEEIGTLATGSKLMTFECGVRFLTDYLNGDTYFATRYPEHNLVRCHTQFKLVADMEEKMSDMKKIVEGLQ